MKTINEYLNGNTYPGRGVLIGKSADNAHYVTAYFIMGRSENSRNRYFEPTEDGHQNAAFDEKKLTDPSIYHYSPVRKVNGMHRRYQRRPDGHRCLRNCGGRKL